MTASWRGPLSAALRLAAWARATHWRVSRKYLPAAAAPAGVTRIDRTGRSRFDRSATSVTSPGAFFRQIRSHETGTWAVFHFPSPAPPKRCTSLRDQYLPSPAWA